MIITVILNTLTRSSLCKYQNNNAGCAVYIQWGFIHFYIVCYRVNNIFTIFSNGMQNLIHMQILKRFVQLVFKCARAPINKG